MNSDQVTAPLCHATAIDAFPLRDGEASDIDTVIGAVRNAVAAMAATGIDAKTIAIALSAAATHEMRGAFGREEAARLAARMYERSYLA